MSSSTTQERRQKAIRRAVILGVVLSVIALLIFDQAARSEALSLTSLLENLRDARGATATIAVTLLILFAVVENAEKLHFIWEMGHRLLGYDLEVMARHEREFTELPDDYVRRPAMERALTTELAPADDPKLVVFAEEHDAGKTTLLHYVIPRTLNRVYHGNVINCRGDLQSIESEIGDDEEQRRRRLAKRVLRRVIQHAEVPGDIGDTISSMTEAITDYFAEAKKPWLIIIDQIDSPNFPYLETLPPLFGRSNTVVIVANRDQVDQRAYTVEGESGRHVVRRQDFHLQPFSADEALTMFRQEALKRRGILSRETLASLRSRLTGTWPGAIQRLSDIYVHGGGALGIERMLDPTLAGARRAKSFTAAIVEELPEGLRSFLAGLALLMGESVSEQMLRALGATGLCKSLPFATIIEECISRQYLVLLPMQAGEDSAHTEQRYALTKLGRSVANLALSRVGRDAELQLGATLLQYYRDASKAQSELDIQTEASNIVGMMGWAESISHLPDRDIIRFTRQIRDALYRAGQWEVELTWLNYSQRAATHMSLFRSVGELAAARAQALLASGNAASAQAAVEAARAAFQESADQVELNRRLGSATEELLRASLDYDHLQLHWLTHIETQARIAVRTTQHDLSALQALSERIDDALAWLESVRAPVAENAPVAQALHIALTLDHVQLALLRGDAEAQHSDLRHARAHWRTARARVAHERATISAAVVSPGVRRESLAQIERAEGAIRRRYAVHAHLLNRLHWYIRANRSLTRSLAYATGLRLEEALTRFESSELQLVGVSLTGRLWKPSWYTAQVGRLSVRFLPQWYRLRAAHRSLLKVNADAAAIGAHALQFSVLVALTRVTRQLGKLERNQALTLSSQEFARSAAALAQRLYHEAPHLAARLGQSHPPDTSFGRSPAPLPSHDSAAPVR